MSFEQLHRFKPAAAAALVAATLLVAACGRTPVDPGSKPSAAADASPDPAAGGGPADPAPGGGAAPTGGGAAGGTYAPAPAAGGAAPGKPAGSSGLRPLPKVTPVPPTKSTPGKAPDPAAARASFSDLLLDYGYAAPDNSPQNLQSQLLPMIRTPLDHPERLKWLADPNLEKKYEYHINDPLESWPEGMSFAEWQQRGYELAGRMQNYAIYVARTKLYQSLLSDRYHEPRDVRLLIFYKRLNNTPYAVTFQADGTIDDFCAYSTIMTPGNRQLFLQMPAAYYQ